MSDEAGKCQQIEEKYQKSRPLFSEVPEITAEQLLRRCEEEDFVIVDARSPQEQAVSMLPGAITAEQFEADRETYQGRAVVTYCTIGHRSGLLAQQLHAQGCDVSNLKGAILSWTHVGGELVDANGPTKRVHVYSPKMNLIAEGYEAVW